MMTAIIRLTTPIGRVYIHYQTRPFFLRGIRLPVWKTDAGPVHPGAVRSVIPTDIAALRQITDLLSLYFSGTAVTPPWALFNMAGLTVLQQRVMRAVADIPFGRPQILRPYRGGRGLRARRSIRRQHHGRESVSHSRSLPSGGALQRRNRRVRRRDGTQEKTD
jgi:hypothetical protein